MAVSWNFISKFKFSNKNFAKIYRFFVIETPLGKEVSQRCISFANLGWEINKLNKELKRTIPFLKTDWVESTAKEARNTMVTYGIFASVNLPREVAIHTQYKNSKTAGLFYAIRCAFAHGAFSLHTCKGETYYFFENKDGETYKGRIVIKESSLLSIIGVVNSKTP